MQEISYTGDGVRMPSRGELCSLWMHSGGRGWRGERATTRPGSAQSGAAR